MMDSGEKPPKITGVRRADARARKHRDGKFRNHRHVDRDPVSAANAQFAQAVGEAAYIVEELAIGDGPAVSRLAFEIVGNLITVAGADVPIEAVDGRVQLAIAKPAGERLVPLERNGERFAPLETTRPLRPKLGIVAFGIHVDLRVRIRLAREVGRGGEPPALFE